ncbi:hypothetical protein SSX86_027699 [Deinandra increscens subsp. villosa]|uniref:GTD-binding domain-containing protein n=1 Tax=Deinandra increscens subsp. villosa TaxID=3103831 RepID=A0AAP0GIN2_9ASTR
MAANKFATMLHNKTNKITLILVYAVLEWTLMILLLLHSVFSYLIIGFARYFGLNPPCFSCSRIDRFRYHLCEFHSKEVSQLRFCSDHQKLGEFHDMCGNCSSSVLGFRKEAKNFVFSKVERIDVIQGGGDCEGDLKCSCCGVNFERKDVDESSCFVIHPFDILDDSQKKTVSDDQMGSNYVEGNQEIESEKQSDEEEDEELETEHFVQFENGEDLNSQDLQFFTDYNGDQLFPFELPDPEIQENPTRFEDEDHEFGDFQEAKINSQETIDSFHQKTEQASEFPEKTLVSHKNLIDFGDEFQEDNSDIHSVHEEDNVSIGTQIPVLDSCDEITHEESSTTSINLHSHIEFGEENAGDLKNLKVKIEEHEEEKAPDTPSGLHSPNPFHKKWLFSKTKDAGAEESFDGSVISETDDSDPVSTPEELKSALKAEREALRNLYAELEEERNASAGAANETMAMITRLQEEKASMQMEALQYRRMMEEQSEYDQEALQLLNEVMSKKEAELESYRKKVSDYDAKEKTKNRSEDDDGSSIDLYHVPEHGNALDGDREIQCSRTPIDSVFDLESTLASFEDERVSILEQLRFLEERLVALSDAEDRHFANVPVIDDHYEEINIIGFSGQVTTEYNRKQAMGKQLFPLFEAFEDDVTVRNGYENGFHHSRFEDHHSRFEDTAVERFELEKKRIDMEEEIDQLYRRLQALEADREFLKHSIGSMKKGEKGMEVLGEILHHLRDLRDVNLRAKSYTESNNL